METFSGDKYQIIPAQTGDLDFFCSVAVSNETGYVNIGLGGTGGISHYTQLNAGKIYDPDNRFVGSYKTNEKIKIQTVYHGGFYDHYVKDNLVSTTTAADPYAFTRIYVQPTGVLATVDDLYLKGYCVGITGNPSAVEPSGGSGRFALLEAATSNATQGLEIYGVEISSTGGFSVVSYPSSLTSSPSEIVISGNTDITFVSDIELTFDTNCGEKVVNYIVSGDPPQPEYLVNFIGFKGLYGRNESYEYKMITYGNLVGHEYNIALDYVSGEETRSGLASGTGLGSGFVSASQISNITGREVIYASSLTGLNLLVETVGGITGQIDGLVSGAGLLVIFATGIAFYDYSVQAVGWHGSDPATGTLTGTLSGLVDDCSGFYYFDLTVTGTPTSGNTATGSIPTPTGVYSYDMQYVKTITGSREEGLYLGIYRGGGTIYEGEKTLIDQWDLETGFLGQTGSNKNYQDEGWLSSGTSGNLDNLLYIGQSTLPAGYNAIYARVTYNAIYSETQLDVARLRVSTEYAETPVNDYDILITGSHPTRYLDEIPINWYDVPCAISFYVSGEQIITELGEDLFTESGTGIITE